MKATIFLGSLKNSQRDSHSAALAKIVQKELIEQGFKTVDLYNLRSIEYEPGVDIKTEGGEADGMTEALSKVLDSDCVIFATPIWWGVHSSLIQAFMERMCYYDDFAIKTAISPIYGKTFGAIISGSDDGFQQVTGLLLNFATNLGFTIPPDAIVPSTVQDLGEIKRDIRTQQHIAIFSRNITAWTQMLRRRKIGAEIQINREPRPAYMGAEDTETPVTTAPMPVTPVEARTEPAATVPTVRDYVKE